MQRSDNYNQGKITHDSQSLKDKDAQQQTYFKSSYIKELNFAKDGYELTNSQTYKVVYTYSDLPGKYLEIKSNETHFKCNLII